MSKASEWAKASMAVSSAQVQTFKIMDVEVALEDRRYTLHCDVGHRNGNPTLCLTDYRLGGIVLTEAQALALAGWIMSTFGEP